MVSAKLIEHWSYPEDHRAFRLYVLSAIEVELRSYIERQPAPRVRPYIAAESEMTVADAAAFTGGR
jgi:hypothetical protein